MSKHKLYSAGIYSAIVREIREKTVDKNRSLAMVKFLIQNKNLRGFYMEFFNICHPNDTAQRISRANIARLIKACGRDRFTRPEDFHGCEIQIQIELKPDKNGVQRNRIVKYAKCV